MFDATADKRQSGAIGVLALVLVVILALMFLAGLLFTIVYAGSYSRATALDQAAAQAWSNVEVQLQRLFYLAGNLVEIVQGTATREKQIFKTVAEARAKYFQAEETDDVEGEIQAANQLIGVLPRLLALREVYPELKSNRDFLALQDQIEDTENRIAIARTRYNEAAARLNAYIQSFRGRFIAGRAGVQPRPYFEPAQGTQQALKADSSTTLRQPAPESAPAR